MPGAEVMIALGGHQFQHGCLVGEDGRFTIPFACVRLRGANGKLLRTRYAFIPSKYLVEFDVDSMREAAMREAEPVPTKPEKEAGKRSGAPTTPSDVKTYSNREAKAEWDDSREAKRRMVLGRIGQRDSNLAVKAWDEMTRVERLEVHVALNEDFISPTWYINAKGQKNSLISVPEPAKKSAAQLAEEQAAACWESMSLGARYNLLLNNGIGRDADQGKFCNWLSLGLELRQRMALALNSQPTEATA